MVKRLSIIILAMGSFTQLSRGGEVPLQPIEPSTVSTTQLIWGQIYTGGKVRCSANSNGEIQPWNRILYNWIGDGGFDSFEDCKKSKFNSLNNVTCSYNYDYTNSEWHVAPFDIRYRYRSMGGDQAGFSGIDDCTKATINSRFKVVCSGLNDSYGRVGAFYIPKNSFVGDSTKYKAGFSSLKKCAYATINVTTSDYTWGHFICAPHGVSGSDNVYRITRVENNDFYSSLYYDIDDCQYALIDITTYSGSAEPKDLIIESSEALTPTEK